MVFDSNCEMINNEANEISLSNFWFDSRRLHSLFIIIVRALSEFLVAFRCFNVSFQFICLLSYYTHVEHVCSPKLAVFYCFIGLCTVKWVPALNCKLINNETVLYA